MCTYFIVALEVDHHLAKYPSRQKNITTSVFKAIQFLNAGNGTGKGWPTYFGPQPAQQAECPLSGKLSFNKAPTLTNPHQPLDQELLSQDEKKLQVGRQNLLTPLLSFLSIL